jgi:hypothetical protein
MGLGVADADEALDAFAASSFCFARTAVNSLMCVWKNSSWSLEACPAATIFMTDLSSGSTPARCASMWMTGSGAGVLAGPGVGAGAFCTGFGGGGRGWGGFCW